MHHTYIILIPSILSTKPAERMIICELGDEPYVPLIDSLVLHNLKQRAFRSYFVSSLTLLACRYAQRIDLSSS